MAFRMKVIQIPISCLLKRHDKQNLCWNMQIDIHKRNNEFTNIYCNYNKHLNYEAFYYMCENNRIFLQDKNCCPNCTNKSINHYSTTIYKRWPHMITTVNCLKPSALKLHFPLLTCTHKVYTKTTFTHVLHNISSLETPR